MTEQEAVEEWLRHNRVRVVPVGVSGIYDEFGRHRKTLKLIHARLARQIRRLRGHARMTHADIAATLNVYEVDVRNACEKHRIGVADGSAQLHPARASGAGGRR